jgi:hypothetical protein
MSFLGHPADANWWYNWNKLAGPGLGLEPTDEVKKQVAELLVLGE